MPKKPTYEEIEQKVKELEKGAAKGKQVEQELKLNEARLNTLFQLSQMTEVPIDEIENFILEKGIMLTGSRIGFLGTLSEDEQVYTLHAVSKAVVKDCAVEGDPMQWHVSGSGIWADAIRNRKTFFFNDYSIPHPSKKGIPQGHIPLQRFMVVPVFEKGRIVAVVGVGNKDTNYEISDERQINLLVIGMWQHLQRNRQKEELQKLNKELERRVEERTVNLKKINQHLTKEIEERKQVSEALRESEEKYRSLTDDVLDSSAVGIFILDSDFRVVWVNRALEDYFGLKRDDIIGKDKRQLIRERIKDIFENPDSFANKVFTTYDDNTYIERFECHVLPDGMREERWLEHRSRPIQSGIHTGGRIENYYDITTRKHAEEALKESEGKLSAMLQSIGDHVSMMDKDLNIIWANEVAKKVFGNGIIGKKCYEAYHRRKEPCEPYPCLTLKAFQDEKVHEHNTKVIDKDGRIIYFHCTANVVLRDKEGKPTAVIEISRDITKRQQAEEEKKKIEAQLHHAQKMESLGRLAGGMAHNFRNILQAIMGNSQYLKMAYSQNKQLQEITRLIDESGKKGSDLIDSLLKCSRQEVEIDMVPLDLKDVLDETYKIISNTLDTKIKIVTNIEGPLPIKGDYSNLNQVFMNICNNAGDSMPDGGVLTIEARRNKQELIVTISDTGCGMNEETLENIFEPFYTTKEVGKGTGLGLSITYGIIEEHHGTISVSPQPGKGTLFKVSFPIAEEFD